MNDQHRVSTNALSRPPEEHMKKNLTESQSSEPVSVQVATHMTSSPLISDQPHTSEPAETLPRPRTSSQDKQTTNLKIYYDKMLGKGSFSKVFPGRYKENIVAVKIITMKHLEKTIAVQLKRELQVIRILQEHPHKNVATYYKIFQTTDKMIIVMELCSGGELTKYIKQGLDLESVRNYFSQILDGYKHLLELNIVHRDIKSANILLSQDKKTVKFIDFGLSKVFSVDLNQTICGSPLYIAPEVLDHRDYDSKSDIWSIGVLLYEMVYGLTPFHHCTVIKTLKQTVQRNAISYPQMSTQNLYVVPPDLINYMKRLLEPDPRRRLDWDELHEAAWLTDVSISMRDVLHPHQSSDLYDVEDSSDDSAPIPRHIPIPTNGSGKGRDNENHNDKNHSIANQEEDLSVSQVEERLHSEKAAASEARRQIEGFSTNHPKHTERIRDDYIDISSDETEHYMVTKRPEISMLTRELSRETSIKAIRNLRHIPRISNISDARKNIFSHDAQVSAGLSDPQRDEDLLEGQLNPFEDELTDSHIEVVDIKSVTTQDPVIPKSVREKRSDPIPIRVDKKSGNYKYDRENNDDRYGSTGRYNHSGRNIEYGTSFPASYNTEHIPRITPIGSGPRGIRGESFGDVVCTELKMDDLSFIENNFSAEYAPLLEQQQKMASNSGLIDINDVSDILITNVPEKTTTYEYISRGSTVVGSYLYSRSAPIATTVIHGLGRVARTTVGAVGNIIISPK